MAKVATPEQRRAYIEKKYCGPWNAALPKIKALEAELAALHAKCKLAPPPGLAGEAAEVFQGFAAGLNRSGLKDIDRYMGEVKHQVEYITRRFNTLKQQLR